MTARRGEGGGREDRSLPSRPGSTDRRPGLDREELDRVIRRAVELQFAGAEDRDRQQLTDEEVIRIGREVGLEPRHVRRALGELRAESLVPRDPEPKDLASRLLGSARVVTSRVVPGQSEDVAKRLEEYLRVGESLRPVRKRGLRSRWEAERGIVAQLQRGLGWGGRTYELARTSSLEANVNDLEKGFSLVSLDAELSSVRAEQGWGWGLGLGLGSGGAGLGIGLAVGFPWLVVPAAAVGLASSLPVARRGVEKEAERIRTAMEGILDRLEAGEPLLAPAPSIRDRLARP